MRILTNLIDNAHKYSPPGATIELSAVREDAWLRFAVADRGPGIEAGENDRVFEAFYRSPQARTSGVGLGLAIAKQAIDAHGGSIRVQNLPGNGCIVVLELPIA